MSKETSITQKKPTKETFKSDPKKESIDSSPSWQPDGSTKMSKETSNMSKETYINQKRHTKKTHKRAILTRVTLAKETCRLFDWHFLENGKRPRNM